MPRRVKLPVQVIDGKWYAIASGKGNSSKLLEECCDCGLVHRVEYKVENGRIWQRWLIDDDATRKARKRSQRFVPRRARQKA